MLRNLLPAFAASFVLLAGPGAWALKIGTGPIDPTDPPVVEDPCLQFPELCIPDPPPPPPPVDPCKLSPVLCNPEPPVADPTPPQTFSHAFAGPAKVKGDGFKTIQPYTLQMNFDTASRTFSAMDPAGQFYTGNLVPKGTQGNKFRLFLDVSSTGAFAADVAARAATASGRSAGTALGESSKLILVVNPDGSASLKIKSEVLVNGIGEVSFKASLTAAVQ